MKKIKSLFKRDYDGDRLVYDEVVDGCEWVLAGEGVATIKYDGSACAVFDDVVYKRYDRKKNGKTGLYKPPPKDWQPCQQPDDLTGHWPGWVPISDKPEDQWHYEGYLYTASLRFIDDGTYELVGPKIQANPYGLEMHELWKHGEEKIECPRDFEGIKSFLSSLKHEGIVFHHQDGRMCKIRRRDFGFEWPILSQTNQEGE